MKNHSGLSLFPLCDSRGWLTDILLNDESEHRSLKAENLFFAWLLELPVGMDSALAARTLLDYAERHDTGAKSALSPELREYRRELRALLFDLSEGGPARASREPDSLNKILDDLRRV